MPKKRVTPLTELLRERILEGVEMGSLRAGDRLPGARVLSREMQADPRVIAAVLRGLAREGLVEIRPRSGTYVARRLAEPELRIPRAWASQVFAEALEHGVVLPKLATALHDLVSTHGIRAAVTAATSDQTVWIVRELRERFGITAIGVPPEALVGGRIPRAITRANLLVTTGIHAAAMGRLAAELGKRLVTVVVRQDVFDAEWLALLDRTVYVVTADDRFPSLLERYLAQVAKPKSVRMMVAGRDDLASIPHDAVTYVTEGARRVLGHTRLPGILVRPKWLFDESTVRELVEFILLRAGENGARRRS
jgi:DNA-binding transcriptional regulator YhcF (GntR family)